MWRRFRGRVYAGTAALGASAAAALTAALPLLSAYLAIGMGILAVAAMMLNMAYTNAVLSTKIDNLQDSLAGLANTYKTQVTNTLGPLLTADISFLASITGPMGHQTTANNTIDTTAGSLSNADRVSINGLVNAVNILQGHLQTANLES
jgi:hypothetical protein